MAENVGLPPGFVLDQPQQKNAVSTGLPAGFVLDQPEPQQSQQESGFWQKAWEAQQPIERGAKLAIRSIAEGLASLPLAAADLAAYPVNLASRALTGSDALGSYQQLFQTGLNELGFPNYQGAGEELAGAIGRGASSAAGGIGVGQLLQQAPGAAARGVGDVLVSAPGVQAAAAGSAGAGGELARQAGAGPEAQQIASLAGGLVGGGLTAALSPRSGEISAALPAGSRTGPELPKTAATLRGNALSQAGRTEEYTTAVKQLERAKIPLTQGQRSGTNWVKSTERTLSEVPFSGKPLQGVFEKQQQAYQKELLKLAGNQRGDQMITRQALENTGNDLSREYTKALAGKAVNIADDNFLDDLARIEAKHSQFVDDPSKLKVKQIVNSFLDEAAKKDTVTGEWYQAQRSLFAKRAMKNTDVADLFGDLKTLLDDAFTRAAGNVKGGLDSQYARYKQLLTIYERSGGPAASEGFISPVAVAREAAGAPGGKTWQDFTRAAATVMPDRLGNSGTAQRNFILGLAGGSVPAALIEPATGLLSLGGVGAARGTASLLARQPTVTQPLLNPLPPSIAGILEQQTSQ